MDKKYKKIINIAAAAFGLLIICAVLVWAKPCAGTITLASGMTAPMACHYTGRAAIWIGAILFTVGLESLFKNKVSSLAYFIIGVVLIILPISSIGIGVCAKEGMACAQTELWLRIAGIGTCICGIASFLLKGEKDL